VSPSCLRKAAPLSHGPHGTAQCSSTLRIGLACHSPLGDPGTLWVTFLQGSDLPSAVHDLFSTGTDGLCRDHHAASDRAHVLIRLSETFAAAPRYDYSRSDIHLCVAGRAPHPEGTRGCPYSPVSRSRETVSQAENDLKASSTRMVDHLFHTILFGPSLRSHVEQTLPTEGPVEAEAVEEATRHV